MKRRKIFICVFAAAVLINIIFVLIFKDRAVFSFRSLIPVIIMIPVSINGIAAFFLRHKENCLILRRRSLILTFLSEDDDYTFTEEYKKEFFRQFCVYWFAIPFYIPCIFFTLGPWDSLLWPTFVMFAPQLIYSICEIPNDIKAEKEYKIRKQKQEQELKEQKLREELGHFK